MFYKWEGEVEVVMVVQHFHANSISETTHLEGYQENPNFQTNIPTKALLSSIKFKNHQRAGKTRAGSYAYLNQNQNYHSRTFQNELSSNVLAWHT